MTTDSNVKHHPQYGTVLVITYEQGTGRNMSHMDLCNMKSQVSVLLANKC